MTLDITAWAPAAGAASTAGTSTGASTAGTSPAAGAAAPGMSLQTCAAIGSG